MSISQPYIIDTQTDNMSFKKMYKVLKAKGIKNNKFFLKLYDKSLQGVNPRDEDNLTKEQKIRIIAEIKRNPWYFFREVVMLNVAGGKKRYELHRGNLALTWCRLNCLNSITLLPRQHGKTVSSLCVDEWFYRFGALNSNILFVHKDFGGSKNNLKILKEIDENLPSYLKTRDKKDVDNLEYITNTTTGNTVRALSSAMSASEADKRGRGLTAPLVLWDEFAFLKYNKIMFQAAAPAQSQARVEARKHNSFYGTTIITTPNNIDNNPESEGTWCKSEMIEKACRFDEAMYDWTIEEIQECLDKKSDNDFLYIEFSYKQLGRDENWYRENCRALNNDLLKIKREILLEWTKASDVSVFSEEQLVAIEKHVKEPVSKIVVNKFWTIDLYTTNIDYDKPWVISCDVGTGLSQDASAITIFHPLTFEIIGEFRENKIDTEDFKQLIFRLVGFYFRNSMVVIENNSIGITILQYLMKTPIARNLYYEYKDRKAQKIEKSKTQIVHTSKKEKVQIYGVSTTSNSSGNGSRDLMLEILNDTVNNEPEKLATPNLFSDIKGLERDSKGKIGHGVGLHDDSLFSYLVGRYALAYGTNLARFQMPINGKAPTDRKSSMVRMSSNLKEANSLDARPRASRARSYNGLANDIIEESAYLDLRKKIDSGGRIGTFTKLSQIEELNKIDRFGSIGHDL